MRDERAERRHLHLAGKGLAVKGEFGERKAPGEGHVLEMRHARHRVAVGAKAVAVPFAAARRARGDAFVGAVEDAGVDQLAVPLGLDGEMAVAVVHVDRRAVADAPIDQPAGPRQRDASRPQAAERKRHILAALAGEDEALVDSRRYGSFDNVVHRGSRSFNKSFRQFLMPLIATPSITIFCASKNSRITGSTAMLIAAITSARLPDCM